MKIFLFIVVLVLIAAAGFLGWHYTGMQEPEPERELKVSRVEPAQPAPRPGTAAPEKTTVRNISPDTVWSRMQAGEKVILLDVRTKEEFDNGHIPGTLFLPVGPEEEFGPGVEKIIPEKSATVYVYCRSGRRSLAAAEIMQRRGYADVYNLGGIIDWKYETTTDAE